jgi:hypothetical protein
MQAFGLSLIKGRLGIGSGTAERRTPPERENPPAREGWAAGTRRTPRFRRGENVEDVERRRGGEGWRMSVRNNERTPSDVDEKALLADRNPRNATPGRSGNGRRLGPPFSAGEGRRRPNPCKGWPTATASGGFGLDKGLAVAIWRCSRDRRVGGRLDPDPLPATAGRTARKKARPPIDRKAPIRARS